MDEQDYTIIKDQRIRKKICDLMSEMLDNPDENGIYPTSKFMWFMEQYVLDTRLEAIGWTWAEACVILDSGKDPRKHDEANLLVDAKKDLDR